MRKKRWIVVGLDGCGKTQLCNYIEGYKSEKRNSQELIYREKTLQIPSSYLENTWMNNIIIMLAQNQGKANIFLLDARSLESMYSPAYAKAFTKDSIAIVNHAEYLDEESRDKAKKIVEKISCDHVLFLSFKTGEGVDELDKWLEKTQ